MIWLNPWGWLGLAAIAAPILAHLVARQRARHLPFPTLRFLEVSRLTLVRRHRLSDFALLAVRCGILATAAAALAQPWLATANRERDLGRALARAVIVDDSASMRRLTPTGGTALDAANQAARRLSADANRSVVETSSDPARELAGAAAWLATQPGRREIVVVSDFQIGAIDSANLARLPAEIGVRLVRIDVSPANVPLQTASTSGGTETIAHITLAHAQTDVEWTTRPRDAEAAESKDGLLLLAGPNEAARAGAAADTARAAGARPLAADRPVAVVFPEFAGRDALLGAAGPLTDPWMFDTVARLRRDPTLAAAASSNASPGARAATSSPTSLLVVATGADHLPLVLAARGRVEGRDKLLLFPLVDAGSLTSAALLASVAGATEPATPIAELDPSVIADDVLRTWERPAGAVAPRGARDLADASDGRWLWGLALALLGLETWMRRANRSHTSTEVVHARVA